MLKRTLGLWCAAANMDYRGKIQTIRSEYLRGKITLEVAEAQVKPMLVEMNKKGAAIAKEHGKRYKPLTFGYVFR